MTRKIAALLALLLSAFALFVVAPSMQASAYSSTYPVQATMVYTFVPGIESASGHFVVTAAGIPVNTLLAPQEVTVHLSAWDSGNVYFSGTCVLTRMVGTYLPCSINVPYEAGGSLQLGATFTGNSGNIVAQGIIDPLLEPSWN